MASAIPWHHAKKWAAEPLQPFIVKGMDVGAAKSYEGLHWVQVESAGHMVPLDQPAAAADAINKLLLDIVGYDRFRVDA